MKKLILIFIAIIGASYTQAQNINPENDHVAAKSSQGSKEFKADSQLPQWCIDVNITGGFLTQNITSANPAAQYLNSLNSNISGLNFSKGSSFGFDIEGGYFFNKKRNFGIGAGIWYMRQAGNVTMDNFQIEYQSWDKSGNTFRQKLTANQAITESLKISNFNIPLLLKYKKRFSKNIGFTADAGLLFNLIEKNSYNTNASFDYEAIYKYSGSQGGVTTVYDNSVVPGSSDLLITKKQYVIDHPNADIQSYFNTLRSQGNNVGLGVKPNNNTGSISYKSGSVGFLIRPAISFYLSDKIALNLGAYYLYQGFTHSSSGNYMLTNKTGDYNSVLNGVSKSANSSYGISFGTRYFIGKTKEKTIEPAIAPEEEKAEEVNAGETEEENANIPEPVSISTPVLFDVNKTEIKPSSYPVLEEAVKELNENKNIELVIHGYTDITGPRSYNKTLSEKRAMAVKKYLQNKGVKAKSLKTVGHGVKSPAASNRTAEGRAKNRRVEMKVKKG